MVVTGYGYVNSDCDNGVDDNDYHDESAYRVLDNYDTLHESRPGRKPRKREIILHNENKKSSQIESENETRTFYSLSINPTV